MAKTVADILWEMLEGAGVKRCYGIVGDALNPVIEALHRKLSFAETRIFGRPFTLEDLIALFLRGILPRHGAQPPGTLMVAVTFMSWVSTSETVPSTRLLRNQCRPSPFGQKLCAPLPVCRRPTTEPSLGSTETRPSSPVKATSRRLLSGSTSAPAGA